MGRFISRDPWEGTPYDPQSLNRYVYCSNNPVNWVDPNGFRKFYENWCGRNWSGGQTRPLENLTPEERKKLKKPVDAMDECCKKHDERYSDCRVKRKRNECKGEKKYGECIDVADKKLLDCLKELDKDPSKWVPPASNPQEARRKRWQAERLFRIKRWLIN